MDLTKLTKENRVIYECMWGNKTLSMNVEPNSDIEKTTYKISGELKENGEAIKKAYNINNEQAFENKYKQAISGNGNAKKYILSLHSSSRLALLIFFNIEEKPITINIEGKDIVFNYSTFEFKNPVINPCAPSNIDVVLLSEDRKTVLFLESKFAEYYLDVSKKSSFISDSYRNNNISKQVYTKLNEIGIKSIPEKNVGDKNFAISMVNESKNYLNGIKQIISHYVGIIRRLNGDTLEDDNTIEKNEIVKNVLGILHDKDSKVYLGEILYDKFYLPNNCKEIDPKTRLDAYSELYTKLAKLLNNEILENKLKSKFKVIEKDFGYSEIINKNKGQIEQKILSFYGF